VIDIKFLREQPDAVRASQRARGEDEAIVDAILTADERRRSSISEFEALRAEQKSFGKQVAAAKGEQKQELVAAAKATSERVKELQAAADTADTELATLVRRVGNIVLEGVPSGGEDDYTVLETVGTARDFAAEGFEPKDHLELAEGLDALDMARGAKVGGSRFYFLKGVGARLELALLNMAIAQAVDAGFIPMITPTLVKADVMAGAGFLDAHADEVYRLEADDLYLTGTSEVALAGYHADEILDLSAGPKRYAGWSACYRREAGSYGKDTRGIIRVHQFQKVEMFSYCRPEEAAAEHQRLLEMERQMLAKIEVPYRIIDTAAGDLGGPAARKFDCEAWVPTQGRFRELTSTSNCTTYQARRLNIRERDPQSEVNTTRHVATLNGTLATTRWIVAILENHQQADGSVVVPAGLRPFLGLDVLTPASSGQ
jgi:seryl-tRNA synthetase